MKRWDSFSRGATLGAALFIAGVVVVAGQSAEPQIPTKLTADQQKQAEQLKLLEEQLQKDREAMHSAITQYGWDSDQVDEAQEKLFRDRAEYRKLRRSLRAAGVAVPPAPGLDFGTRGDRPGRMAGRMPHHGRGGHHCADCDCPCCR